MGTPCCPPGSFPTAVHNEGSVKGAYFPMEAVAQIIHKYEFLNLFSILHK